MSLPWMGLVAVVSGLLAATAGAQEDQPSADEAAFLRRHGVGQACDTVAIARKLESTVSLPVRRLSSGSQKVEFRYLESGWPLGLPGVDAERPVRLGDAPGDPVRNLPALAARGRRFGTLVIGPEVQGANRFSVVLDGDSSDWSSARLWVARNGDGDLGSAAPLGNLASRKSTAFATVVVLPLTFPSETGTRKHPVVLWVFTDPKGEWLRYYPISHWRATVELPSGKRAHAVLYDHRGRGDLSEGVLVLVDAGYSPSELFAGADGEDRYWRAPQDGLDWKTRNFLGVGQAVRTPRESVRLKSIAPMGDSAVLEIESR